MPRTGVTFDDIAEAASKLLCMGESPSVQRVREVLGTGSNSTIAEHLKRWKLQRSSKEGAALPEALPKELVPPLETLWHIALEQADDRYLAYKEHTVKQLSSLTTERDTWQQQNQQLENEIKQITSAFEQSQSELIESQKQYQDHQALIQQLRHTLEQCQDQVSQLENRLNQERLHSKDSLNQLESQHQQTLQHWQATTQELKAALQKEQQRSDQSEARWLRVVDQAKDELKALEKKQSKLMIEKEGVIKQLQEKARITQDTLWERDKETMKRQAMIDQQAVQIDLLKQNNHALQERLKHTEIQLEAWQARLPDQPQERPEVTTLLD